MKKTLIIATLLTTAMFAALPAHAASYQDRAMTTGALFGGATGAAIGSNSNQAVEGAIFGAVLGTIAGAIIADNHQPVAYHHPRPYRKHVINKRGHRGHKATQYRHQRKHGYYKRHHKAERYGHQRSRHVVRGYGHKRDGSRWSDYRSAKRHDYRNRSDRHNRSERSERNNRRDRNDS